MTRPPTSGHRRVFLALVVLVVAVAALVIVLLSSGSSAPQRSQRQFASIFQDDQLLIDSPSNTVEKTLRTLHSLGVDQTRVTVLWAAIAPQATQPRPPPGFHAGDPEAYPAAAWAPYDRLVRLAAVNGIGIGFNVTAPGPLWAMSKAGNTRYANHYRPSARAFGRFVAAVGRRYSGSWPATGAAGSARRIPRVKFWTIWNEPNQPGWLAPQWGTVAGTRVLVSPRLYRAYVDAAFAALSVSGHSPTTDTILIGELAPEGSERTGDETPIPPLPFLRALYCVDGAYQPLRGQRAVALHCPAAGNTSTFVGAHPGLFQVSGFAHHPYSFFLAPSASMSDQNFVPLSDLGRLESALDRIYSAYGVDRQLPIYLTEYGYETNPPDPFRGVPPATQARYLEEAQYMAWRDPRVRSMAQFLLIDSAPNTTYKPGSIGYWSTFQTGLEYQKGPRKPAFGAYRLPIWIPQQEGRSVSVWSMLRPATNGQAQQAQIQWRANGGAFTTLTSVTTKDPDGFLEASVQVPGSGVLRVVWRSPSGRVLRSLAAAVK